jgi:ribonuclease PH
VADLDYAEDSNCDTDMNIVMTGQGGIVELQGTAEGATFSQSELTQLLQLGQESIIQLIKLQQDALKTSK